MVLEEKGKNTQIGRLRQSLLSRLKQGSLNKADSEIKQMRYKNGQPAGHDTVLHPSSQRGNKSKGASNEGGSRHD